MTDFLKLSATELAKGVQDGRYTALDVTAATMDRIGKNEDKIKAFITVHRREAVSRAKAVDAKRAGGGSLGLLAGVPIAVKDNMCTRGQRTTCASKILENFVPPYDAHVVERIRAEDGVIIGKTNLDAFAMGSSTENSGFGPTRNPWDLERVPGGSSGGSAAAVAARFVPLALGSDTGGSIRQPASLCGVLGMKPTYGNVSRFGLVAFASSLDQIGPLARNVEDAALLLDAIGGHDKRDSTSNPDATTAYASALASLPEPSRFTIGVAKEFFGEGLDGDVAARVQDAIRLYASLGAAVKEISLPHAQYSVAAYYIIATAEASSNLARYDGVHYGFRARDCGDIITLYAKSRAEGFVDEVKRRIMLGTFVLSSGYYDAYYNKAQRVRNLIRGDFDEAFREVDLILGPTSPTPAFRTGEKTSDPLSMYLSDIYTISANLAGIPGISIPCGLTQEGLPVGLQLLAPIQKDKRLLQAAMLYERETDWHQREPAMENGGSCREGTPR